MNNHRDLKGNSLHKNTSHGVQTVKIGPPVFDSSLFLPNLHNHMLYHTFQSASYPKVLLPVLASTPHLISYACSMNRRPLSTPNCISIGSAVFAQLTAVR